MRLEVVFAFDIDYAFPVVFACHVVFADDVVHYSIRTCYDSLIIKHIHRFLVWIFVVF